MTAGPIGLVAAWLVLAVLLLSLNLRSGWRWPVKAVAIALTSAFAIAGFLAVQAMLGWPTEAPPPARFRLHAALVHEPDRRVDAAGAIYLWVSPEDQNGRPNGPPRAYALPYSRALHEAAARAQQRLQTGERVDGTASLRADRQGGWSPRSVQVELFEAPVAQLPPKASG